MSIYIKKDGIFIKDSKAMKFFAEQFNQYVDYLTCTAMTVDVHFSQNITNYLTCTIDITISDITISLIK